MSLGTRKASSWDMLSMRLTMQEVSLQESEVVGKAVKKSVDHTESTRHHGLGLSIFFCPMYLSNIYL